MASDAPCEHRVSQAGSGPGSRTSLQTACAPPLVPRGGGRTREEEGRQGCELALETCVEGPEHRALTSTSPSWGDQAGNPRPAVCSPPSGPGPCLRVGQKLGQVTWDWGEPHPQASELWLMPEKLPTFSCLFFKIYCSVTVHVQHFISFKRAALCLTVYVTVCEVFLQ